MDPSERWGKIVRVTIEVSNGCNVLRAARLQPDGRTSDFIEVFGMYARALHEGLRLAKLTGATFIDAGRIGPAPIGHVCVQRLYVGAWEVSYGLHDGPADVQPRVHLATDADAARALAAALSRETGAPVLEWADEDDDDNESEGKELEK